MILSTGSLAIVNNGQISDATFGSGDAGSITVGVAGRLSIDGTGENPLFRTGITSEAIRGSTGNAGGVIVSAGSLSIVNNGTIETDTQGTGSGNAGSVSVNIAGALTIDGIYQSRFTGISSSSTEGSNGNAGDLKISAGTLSIANGSAISTNTDGSGAAGAVAVALAGDSTLSGGALITSSTTAAGNGGTVQVSSRGPLTLTDPGTGIIASASSTASGNAGSVMIEAPQITIVSGAEIASSTAGTGSGGSVDVTTPGALVLDGGGDPNTGIAASATGPQSAAGGAVTVNANTLTIGGGAQIASSTAGPGKGGDVGVTIANDVALSGTAPDGTPSGITARSTGGGDAGSITVSAVRLLMNNGAAISTEAETSTASGGNITLSMRDFHYLVDGEITTSVKGETGNGGNITIDPQFVILDHSSIIAEAVEGHGGNITINAGAYIASADSVVSATSQLGISGTVVITMFPEIGDGVGQNGTIGAAQHRGRRDSQLGIIFELESPDNLLVLGENRREPLGARWLRMVAIEVDTDRARLPAGYPLQQGGEIAVAQWPIPVSDIGFGDADEQDAAARLMSRPRDPQRVVDLELQRL